MFTISFLSSSDMDELSISSEGTRAACYSLSFSRERSIVLSSTAATCVVLLFITDAKNRLHAAVRFAYTVAAADVPAGKNDNISIGDGSEHTKQ